MPVLTNPKHELFAQEVAKGVSIGEAYESAGYSAKNIETARACGSRLLTDANIQARVAELQLRGATRTEITIAQCVQELARIGFANMSDYIKTQEDGSAYVDLANLTREQAAAIQEITTEEYKDGRGEDGRDIKRVKIKLADKRAPLVDILRHLGGFIDRQEVGAPGEFARMTDAELREAVRRDAEEISRALKSATSTAKKPSNGTIHPGTDNIN